MKDTYRQFQDFLLGRNVTKISDLGVGPLLFILLLAVAAAFLASRMYVRFYGGRATGTQIHRAFPLLGLSITGIFVCIQFSLALSLGLLGALSIIRFRTPIKEPEEVAFVMLVIATSIAAATFNLLFLAALLVVAYGSLWLLNYGFSFTQPRGGHGSLVLRLSETDYREQAARLAEIVERHLPRAQLDSVALDGESCLLTYVFPQLTPAAFATVETELRGAVPRLAVNVFYSRVENLV